MSLENELNHTLKKLKDIESALNESSIVAITDHKGKIQFANDKFCEISKYSREELIGKDHRMINSDHHSKEFIKSLWKTIKKGEVWRGEFKNKAKDGTYYWVETTIVPFLDEKGNPYQFVSIRHDITERKRMEEHMQDMAYLDPLTLLPNRNSLNKRISDGHMTNKLNDHVAVLFLDLDRFKSINDRHGHMIGDLLLKEVGQRLVGCLPHTGFLSRQGGDEFVIMLDQINNKQEVVSVIQNIERQLSFPFYIRNKKISISASIGVSMEYITTKSPNYQEFIESLMKEANHAMYQSKQQGGHTYFFSTPKQSFEMARNYQLQREIEKAFELNEYYLVYQPLVNLENGEVEGAEALLRWKNATLGMVSAAEFIPMLEEMGHIIPVGRWVISSACKQLKNWQNSGYHLNKVSVNVSPIQFRDAYFVNDIKRILEETMLDPKYLELEITEGVLLNIEVARKTLVKLKELGVNISIDDFGTGYSSLSYLKHLPVDTIKIDKSFIHELGVDGEIIVNTIINLGRNLQFTVIAEGIENESQVTALQQQKCDIGQGYFFSKPVHAKQFITELTCNKNIAN
ncbi:EAL domain-containing protein [Halalkalibacter okhensis]|uniref:EAL domain-containing protein n=1 Tax=Halalkalibacter okhensis TaxID=333138 RepID=UPI00068B61A1|nr:EAL domain-containing protein [Halalkalibacter okhensis]